MSRRKIEYDTANDEIIIEMMKEGASIVEVCSKIGIPRATLYTWLDKKSPNYKEHLAEVVQEGKELSQGWWERQARENLDNKSFNAALWFMNMKNRFKQDWRDKHEVEQDTTIKIKTITDIDQIKNL